MDLSHQVVDTYVGLGEADVHFVAFGWKNLVI